MYNCIHAFKASNTKNATEGWGTTGCAYGAFAAGTVLDEGLTPDFAERTPTRAHSQPCKRLEHSLQLTKGGGIQRLWDTDPCSRGLGE